MPTFEPNRPLKGEELAEFMRFLQAQNKNQWNCGLLHQSLPSGQSCTSERPNSDQIMLNQPYLFSSNDSHTQFTLYPLELKPNRQIEHGAFGQIYPIPFSIQISSENYTLITREQSPLVLKLQNHCSCPQDTDSRPFDVLLHHHNPQKRGAIEYTMAQQIGQLGAQCFYTEIIGSPPAPTIWSYTVMTQHPLDLYTVIFDEQYTSKHPLNLQRCLHYTQELLACASKLYQHGVVHADLKAENVLVGKNGGLIICDYGTAIKFDEPMHSCASLHTKAPELLVHQVELMRMQNALPAPKNLIPLIPASPKIDAFAVGVILLELWGGEIPEPDQNLQSIQQHILFLENRLAREIRTQKYLDTFVLENPSADLRQLITQLLLALLNPNHQTRMTMQDAFETFSPKISELLKQLRDESCQGTAAEVTEEPRHQLRRVNASGDLRALLKGSYYSPGAPVFFNTHSTRDLGPGSSPNVGSAPPPSAASLKNREGDLQNEIGGDPVNNVFS